MQLYIAGNNPAKYRIVYSSISIAGAWNRLITGRRLLGGRGSNLRNRRVGIDGMLLTRIFDFGLTFRHRRRRFFRLFSIGEVDHNLILRLGGYFGIFFFGICGLAGSISICSIITICLCAAI